MRIIPYFQILLLLSASSSMAFDSGDPNYPGNGNPLVPGYFADPTIKKFGDTYYLYTTTDGIKLASGEPQVWISKDFVNWYNVEMDLQLPPGLTNNWAPDVVYSPNGRYYYYQGNCQQGCNIYGYVSEDPAGPWIPINGGNPVIPVNTGFPTLPALDAQYFYDDDGFLYAYFGTWCTHNGGIGWVRVDTSDMHTILEEGGIPLDQVPEAFEAAYMLKQNDKYLLMYSSGSCHYSSYKVQYAYSDHPTGPYIFGINNPILETNADHSVDGPGHHSILTENGETYIIYHRHDNPHSTGGLFRQVCADRIVIENDSTVTKVEPTHSGIGYLGPDQVPYENLAFGAAASASSYYHIKTPATRYSVDPVDHRYLPSFATDDNNGTLWKAGDNLGPHSLVVDLGEVKDIQRVMTQFEYPTLYYQYTIEYSSDSIHWDLFADRSENRSSGSPMVDDLGVQTRYLRITVLGTEMAGMYPAIWNVKIYNGLFEIPVPGGPLSPAGPGAHSTKQLLMEMNIDTLALGDQVNGLVNSGSLGGTFTSFGSPVVDWVDSVKAVLFNSNNYLILDVDAPTLDYNSSYTAAVWVYNPTVGYEECLMVWDSRRDMLMSSYTAMMYGTGPYGAVAHGDGYVDLPYNQVPGAGSWHHIAVSFDGMLEKVYVDGELDTEWPISLFVKNDRILIGSSGRREEIFSGYITSARLYDWPMNEEQVARLLEDTRPEKVEKPVGLEEVNSSPEQVFQVTYQSDVPSIMVRGTGWEDPVESLRLYAMDGRQVYQHPSHDVSDVDICLAEKGIFLLVIESKDKALYTKKILAY